MLLWHQEASAAPIEEEGVSTAEDSGAEAGTAGASEGPEEGTEEGTEGDTDWARWTPGEMHFRILLNMSI